MSRIRMRPRLFAAAAIVTALGVTLPAAAQVQQTWPHWPRVSSERFGRVDTLAPGVQLAADTIHTSRGTVTGWVARINLADPRVRLRAVAAHDAVAGGGEVLASMARRARAVVAVNGDFFRIWSDSSPINELVIGHQVFQSQRATGPGYAELMRTHGGRWVIGHPTFAGHITVATATGTATEPLTGINTVDPELAPPARPAGAGLGAGAVLVTGALGRKVALGAHAIILAIRPDHGRWRVTHVSTSRTLTPPRGGWLLVGTGPAGRWLRTHLGHGGSFGLEVSSEPNVETAVGGGQVLVQNGADVLPPGGTDPAEAKSAIGFSADGRTAILVCFNGSDAHGGSGLTRYQLASWLVGHGISSAMMFDDGGSAELAARLPRRGLRVLNHPSDGHERPLADALVVVG